mmetsp:Transcript_12586/g.41243  ORF Transcript_12586/g.41243 Transcript_12586/m.41243 type:complete len:509 (-) Transcript_12586:1464-2990(-)
MWPRWRIGWASTLVVPFVRRRKSDGTTLPFRVRSCRVYHPSSCSIFLPHCLPACFLLRVCLSLTDPMHPSRTEPRPRRKHHPKEKKRKPPYPSWWFHSLPKFLHHNDDNAWLLFLGCDGRRGVGVGRGAGRGFGGEAGAGDGVEGRGGRASAVRGSAANKCHGRKAPHLPPVAPEERVDDGGPGGPDVVREPRVAGAAALGGAGAREEGARAQPPRRAGASKRDELFDDDDDARKLHGTVADVPGAVVVRADVSVVAARERKYVGPDPFRSRDGALLGVDLLRQELVSRRTPRGIRPDEDPRGVRPVLGDQGPSAYIFERREATVRRRWSWELVVVAPGLLFSSSEPRRLISAASVVHGLGRLPAEDVPVARRRRPLRRQGEARRRGSLEIKVGQSCSRVCAEVGQRLEGRRRILPGLDRPAFPGELLRAALRRSFESTTARRRPRRRRRLRGTRKLRHCIIHRLRLSEQTQHRLQAPRRPFGHGQQEEPAWWWREKKTRTTPPAAFR